MIAFTVPGPPVPKARARVVSPTRGQRLRGEPVRAFTPARTVEYEKHVGLCAWAARTQYEARGAAAWELTCDVFVVEIDVFRKAKRGDIDNFAKAILDGCNGVLWLDDAQVKRLVVEIHDSGAPGVEVRVRARS